MIMVQSYNYLYVSSVSICNTSGGEYGSHSLCRRTTVFTRLVSPKSHNLIREKSLLNTRILSSLMSRCTNSRLWIWCTAAANCLATLFAWSSPNPVSVTLDVKSPKNGWIIWDVIKFKWDKNGTIKICKWERISFHSPRIMEKVKVE